jgi:hypothetical protein
MNLTQREKHIVRLLLEHEVLSSSQVHTALGEKSDPVSSVTVKRALSQMAERGILTVIGSGRTTTYRISLLGRIFADIDVHAYCAIEPDQRFGMKRYNFELFSGFPKELFSLVERQTLEQATEEYIRRTTDLIKTKMAAYSYSGSLGTLSGARGFATSGTGLYGGPITLTSYIWEYLGNPCPTDICPTGSDTTPPTVPTGLVIE